MSDSMHEFDRLPKPLLDELTSIIRENRKILEESIIRSVRKLLNVHYERQRLDEQHSVIQNLISTKNQRKKKLVAEATKSLKEGTANVPMGGGSAANLALTVAGTAANAVIDSAEERRQFTEAQQKLESAQVQMYVSTPDNYTLIARKVARRISFKVQLLLGMLAPEGIEVLNKIFKKSMKKYAIERLQEYHSNNAVDEIVCALVDAAIPPHNDALLYREFPKLDFANYKFNMHFFNNIILALNAEVREKLTHAGLATQMLLGGQRFIIDTESLKEVEHENFTVLGALNHANIVCQNFTLATGIERPHELLGFNFKYPLLLQAPGDTLGSMGFNFVPRPTDIKLNRILKRVLLELVPNFNNPKAIEVSAREISEGRVIIPVHEKRHLPLKRNAIPWSPVRQTAALERYRVIYKARLEADTTNPNEITTISNFSRLQAMREAGNEFDLNFARDDVLHAEIEAQLAQHSIYAEIDNDILMTQQRLNAALGAKYLATSASNFMHCLLKYGYYREEDLILASYLIETARTTLNSSRIGPIQEVQQYQVIQQAVHNAKQYSMQCQAIQESYRNKINLLLEHFIPTENKFYAIEQQLTAQNRKNTIKQIKSNISVLKKLTKMAKAIVNIKSIEDIDDASTEAQTILDFHTLAERVYTSIYTINDHNSPLTDIINVIELCLHETRILHAAISRCPDGISQIIADALDSNVRNLEAAQTRYAARNNYEKFISDASARENIVALKNTCLINRNLCRAGLAELENSVTDLNEQDRAFFDRAKAYSKLGRTLYLISQHRNPENFAEQIKELKAAVKKIYLAVRNGRANLASSAYDELIAANSELAPELTLAELNTRSKAIIEARSAIELAISGDIEMTRLAAIQAKSAVNNALAIKKEMEDALARISTLILDLEAEPYGENTASTQQIRSLYAMLSSDETTSSTQSNLDEYTSAIYKALLHIINNAEMSTEDSAESKLEEAAELSNSAKIKNEVISNIEKLLPKQGDSIHSMHDSESFSASEAGSNHSISSSISNWGAWLIVKALHCQLQSMLTTSGGLLSQVAATELELRKIQAIDDEEADELRENKRLALQKIKRAYQDLIRAEQEKSRLTSSSCDHEVSKDLVVDGMLEWGEFILTWPEQRWLDEEKARRLGPILEKQREYLEETATVDPKLLDVITNALDNLQNEKRKYNSLSNRISQKITNIERLYPPTHTENRNPELTRLSRSFERLSAIINKKLEIISTRSEKLEACKQSFTKQILRAYLGFFKLEIDYTDPEPDSDVENTSPTPEATAEPKPRTRIRRSSNTRDTSIEKAAITYSFFDIKEHYDKLNSQYKGILQELQMRNSTHHEDFDSGSESEDYYVSPHTPHRSSPRKNPNKSFTGSLRVSNSSVFRVPSTSDEHKQDTSTSNGAGNSLIQEISSTRFTTH